MSERCGGEGVLLRGDNENDADGYEAGVVRRLGDSAGW